MKAAVFRKYGGPEVVALEQIETPEPADDEVRIRVRAVSINDFDVGLIRGWPLITRLFFGLFRPRLNVAGCDVAGEIDAVGAKVTRWRVGDRVYGDLSGGRFGGFAEYVCAPESDVERMPDELDFVDAAGIPQAAALAWQALNGNGPLRDGLKILINGAGGGVGTYALQLARQHNVEVTGVDTGPKLDMMRTLGFDHVLDYRETDFAQAGARYDLIIDNKSFRGPAACARALAPGGAYVTNGGSMFRLGQILAAAPLYRRFAGKRLKIVALKQNHGLDYFGTLVESGQLRTIVDGPYPFDRLVERLEYFREGRYQGKIILTMPGV